MIEELRELIVASLVCGSKLERVELSWDNYVEFAKEISQLSLYIPPGTDPMKYRFMGIPVELTGLDPLFCRSCGAEAETPLCSYCRTPASFVRLI